VEGSTSAFRGELKQRVFTKVIKMLSWEAWMRRPSGLIESGEKRKHFQSILP
jgi:Fe-S cluster biosynthesis and repair protein YggX